MFTANYSAYKVGNASVTEQIIEFLIFMKLKIQDI